MNKHIVSKRRVAEHGEVLTGPREVNAILDLVGQEAERVDSRFLEPACGTGNFLSAILERKLTIVEGRYAKSQIEFERHSFLAVSSVYGIDILEDNVIACRQRLFEVFDAVYGRLYRQKASQEVRRAVEFVLRHNIVWGDALTLSTIGEDAHPIVFSEWSFFRGSMLKRRDFSFVELVGLDDKYEKSLFSVQEVSDLGEDVFIPRAEREYPLTHFLEVTRFD